MGSEVEEVPRLIIVCDTGPLLHLHQARLLDLLPLAGQIFVPPAVRGEILSVDPIPDWVEIHALDETFANEARAWIQAGLLHAGEAYALGLAKQVAARWLLTDDTAARLIARQEGFEVHGSLGVVLWAVAEPRLDATRAWRNRRWRVRWALTPDELTNVVRQ
jgi:predicted nucleic acid-binding protein